MNMLLARLKTQVSNKGGSGGLDLASGEARKASKVGGGCTEQDRTIRVSGYMVGQEEAVPLLYSSRGCVCVCF